MRKRRRIKSGSSPSTQFVKSSRKQATSFPGARHVPLSPKPSFRLKQNLWKTLLDTSGHLVTSQSCYSKVSKIGRSCCLREERPVRDSSADETENKNLSPGIKADRYGASALKADFNPHFAGVLFSEPWQLVLDMDLLWRWRKKGEETWTYTISKSVSGCLSCFVKLFFVFVFFLNARHCK